MKINSYCNSSTCFRTLSENPKMVGVTVLALGIIVAIIGAMALYGATRPLSLLHHSFGRIGVENGIAITSMGIICFVVGGLFALMKRIEHLTEAEVNTLAEKLESDEFFIYKNTEGRI
jgi:hypothetical protein